jgi:hypothetical protein
MALKHRLARIERSLAGIVERSCPSCHGFGHARRFIQPPLSIKPQVFALGRRSWCLTRGWMMRAIVSSAGLGHCWRQLSNWNCLQRFEGSVEGSSEITVTALSVPANLARYWS